MANETDDHNLISVTGEMNNSSSKSNKPIIETKMETTQQGMCVHVSCMMCLSYKRNILFCSVVLVLYRARAVIFI